jgi:hypothetical protein
MKKPEPEQIYDWQELQRYVAKKLKITEEAVSEAFASQWGDDKFDYPSNGKVVYVNEDELLKPEEYVSDNPTWLKVLKVIIDEFSVKSSDRSVMIHYWW